MSVVPQAVTPAEPLMNIQLPVIGSEKVEVAIAEDLKQSIATSDEASPVNTAVTESKAANEEDSSLINSPAAAASELQPGEINAKIDSPVTNEGSPKTPPPCKKTRSKKRRRKNPNINKQIAMRMNRGIIAWRMAATECRYFTGGTFSKLPKRGTSEYAKIKARQADILAFWISQGVEHKYAMTALRQAAQEQNLLFDETAIAEKQVALNELIKPDDVNEDDWATQREENKNKFEKELEAAKRCFQCFLPVEGSPLYDKLRERQVKLMIEYTQIETENVEWDKHQAITTELNADTSHEVEMKK